MSRVIELRNMRRAILDPHYDATAQSAMANAEMSVASATGSEGLKERGAGEADRGRA